MLEPDIARKCAATLMVVSVVVGASVLASWRISPSSFSTASRETGSAPAASFDASSPAPAEWRPAAGPGAALANQPPASAETSVEELERRAFRLEMDNARLRGRLDDMLAWILDNVRGTYPLPENQMAHLRLVPVDEGMGVSADLVQLLRLSDEEIGRLDEAFLDTRTLLMDLETENIQVDQPEENQVVLSIPPYAEDGQTVRDELYGIVEKTLGAARFGRFLQVAQGGLDEKFEYFGNVDRTLMFEAMAADESGVPQLYVRDERVIPNVDDPMRYDILASERVVTDLPEEYVPYWNWLPETVTRFHRSN